MNSFELSNSNGYSRAMRMIKRHIEKGIEKGFFEIRIQGEKAKNDKVKLKISYAPSQLFTISLDKHE